MEKETREYIKEAYEQLRPVEKTLLAAAKRMSDINQRIIAGERITKNRATQRAFDQRKVQEALKQFN
jgi:hypothetical protein